MPLPHTQAGGCENSSAQLRSAWRSLDFARDRRSTLRRAGQPGVVTVLTSSEDRT